jgi:hypothetical protein
MHDWNPVFVLTRLIALCATGYVLCRIFGVRGLGRLFSSPFRLIRFLALLALVGLAGCASHEKVAVASGPTFPLNPDHWQASAADLSAPDAGK